MSTITGTKAPIASETDRMEIMLDLVRALSSAATPAEVLQAYSRGMVRLNGPAGFISLSCRETEGGGLLPGAYRITRLLSDDNVTDIHKADPWNDEDKPTHRGGLLGEIVTADRPVVINDLDVPDDPVLGGAIAHYRSLLAVPLFERGKPLNWGIQLRREPDAFNADAVEDALLRSNLVGNTVRHVRTAEALRKANQTIRDEVERIAAIQRALLPATLPDIPGLELAADYQTFDRAGGDMYFLHELGTRPEDPHEADGTWGIIIGDVSGHGPAAAVVMAMVESMLDGLPNRPQRPGEVLAHLNRRLCAKTIDHTFVTMCTLLYDPTTRELRYSRAGHPPPMWRKGCLADSSGRADVQMLDEVGGLPLGVLPDEDYPDATVTLAPGQTVVLYTDGIPETRDPQGRFFGTAGIEAAAHHCDADAHCAVLTIRNAVRDHEAGGRPQDDQTLLVLRVK